MIKENSAQEFMREAKKLRDAFAEEMRVLDSTTFRNIASKEMRAARRKVREEMIDKLESRVDALRKHILKV